MCNCGGWGDLTRTGTCPTNALGFRNPIPIFLPAQQFITMQLFRSRVTDLKVGPVACTGAKCPEYLGNVAASRKSSAALSLSGTFDPSLIAT